MRKTLLFILPVALFVGMSLTTERGTLEKYHDEVPDAVPFSSNPPTGKTGAPGEGTCIDCHSGNTFPADGTINFDFSDPNDQYAPGATYTIDLGIATGTKNGFQMTILDASNTMAGSFTAGTNSSTATSGGRQYIRQSSSNGVNNWSFQWTAPSSYVGDLTVYYSFNKSNANGNTSSDSIFIGQKTISEMITSNLTQIEKLKKDYKVYFNSSQGMINVNFISPKRSRVMVKVFDISGRTVFAEDYGVLSGQHNKQINADDIDESGVYLVTLFVDNYVLNEKVFVP